MMLLAIVACKPSVPSEIIQPGDMEDILYDYHVSQAMSRNGYGNADYNRQFYFQAVLRKHGVTEAEFDSSLVYYYSNVRRLQDIYESVNERLNDEAKSLGASVGDINRYQQYSTTGDTASIWQMQSDVLLMARPTMNRFDFTVKADTSFYKGDSFMFQFSSEFIWQSGHKDAVVCIVTRYDGDSTVQHVQHASIGGNFQLRIPAVKKHRLKDMNGFIYLDSEDDSDVRRLMFISQIQLIRFHNKEAEQDDTNEDDQTPKDSIQRGDNTAGPKADTTRRGTDGGRTGEKPVPIVRRNGIHRMETRPD
jgi:hypothetical protein